MNKLITLTGDSGCGKTHLMKLVSLYYKDDFTIIKKYSNREMRLGEENAIEIKPGCTTEEVKKLEYNYVGENEKVYGVPKQLIDNALVNKRNPIVIIGDEKTLVRMCQDYKGKICPIYMQRDTTDIDFIEELKRGNRTEKQIRERLDSRHKWQNLWERRKNLFGYRYIINAQFLNDMQLLNWFEKIAFENNVQINEIKTNEEAKGIISYFRNLWKNRPRISNSDKGAEPIIDEKEEYYR